MWGIIATWRMAVEGISEASHILQEKGDAGDAIETAIKAVEDFPYYKSVGYGGLPNEEMEVELDAAYRPFCTALNSFSSGKRSVSWLTDAIMPSMVLL